MKTIKPEQMSAEIKKIFEEYAQAAQTVVDEAVDKVSQDIVQDLKQTSPKRTGKYAKSWKYTDDKRKRSKTRKGKIVYNTQYQLTHLLEKGHVVRGGGHTEAQPHIAPAAERAEQELLYEIKRGINNQ